MSFISFAQNAEDVMLYRALKHLDVGCYIDIGANHPVEDSVTKAFYDRGWSGVNVEPVTQWYRLLQEARPRDINFKIAVSNTREPLDFYEVSETGLSTLDRARAESCRQEGLKVIRNTVEAWTLESLFEQVEQSETHFLKIDVEGAETQVITSGNWVRYRPWIVLVESTRPNTNISDHQDWEPVLINHGYQFVWFDGINRFYVANEHVNALKHAFCFPVNVLDHYVRYSEMNATSTLNLLVHGFIGQNQATKLDQLKQQLASVTQDYTAVLNAFHDAERAHENAVAALNTIRNHTWAAIKNCAYAAIHQARCAMNARRTSPGAYAAKAVTEVALPAPGKHREAASERPEVTRVYTALTNNTKDE